MAGTSPLRPYGGRKGKYVEGNAPVFNFIRRLIHPKTP